ncbi:hypothetical protein BN1221_04947c [Brenneria goodwinii]|uniref:Uncharacterized protein n=1 Tax=Brenneria goodwinii TaxID=1109412 RepID=A0A0G4K2V2_9GAMM|nr:hypothetical protein BN1221_04947c [Brenneria goodwinii]
MTVNSFGDALITCATAVCNGLQLTPDGALKIAARRIQRYLETVSYTRLIILTGAVISL